MASQWIKKQLWIQGMMLETSAVKVETALNSIKEIRNVNVSFSDSNVTFSYDPEQVKLKTIMKAIHNAGYIASEKPPEKPKIIPSVPAPSPVSNPSAKSQSETVIRKVFKIDGMTCKSCEMRIENRLKKTEGIFETHVSYEDGIAKVSYDPRIISQGKIVEIIEKLDYKVVNSRHPADAVRNAEKMPIHQLIGIGIIIFAGYLIIKNTVGFNFIPSVNQNMGYGILFVVGLITSLHCVAMCGGINLSQTVSYKYSENDKSKWAKLKPSILYNTGRVISYTILGGIVGALGSVVSFSGPARGVVSILAGAFMLLMGLNMLNIFPLLRKITPHMPKVFGQKLFSGGSKRGPFYIGLLNGLMPCGPLQAMQIYALGTGSPVKGALAMLFFSVGTVPLMFGFGAISSFLSGRFTHKMMKVSAALVMVLGIIMLNRGFALSGIDFASAVTPKAAAGSGAVAAVQGNQQTVTTKLTQDYAPITVQKGIPVKWTIQANAGEINGCNQTIVIPKLNITKTLEPGNNEIEFTPADTGNISYTCSMGMIRSVISVVSDVKNSNETSQAQADGKAGTTTGGGMPCCR